MSDRRNFIRKSLMAAGATCLAPLATKAEYTNTIADTNTGTADDSLGSAGHRPILKFNAEHKFRIVQFTDIHLKIKDNSCSKTIELMAGILDQEKPDLVVLTGDIVVSAPVAEAWKQVVQPMIDRSVPWTVTFGNHDHEQGMKNREIMNMLAPMPYCMAIQGDDSLPGSGNYSLSIKASDTGKDVAALYMFDSHSYPQIDIGHYDWIKCSQIDWYRQRSKTYTLENEGQPLPSLAFFHIPLPEFSEIPGTESFIGVKNEGVASPSVNSGLYTAMVESRDVIGVFVGHDHDNNYSGILNDICLAFGQVTGYNAYGDLERGARVIELHEGAFRFDSWIRTGKGTEFKFNYPSGMEYSTEGIEFLSAASVMPTRQGLNYRYYEGKFKRVADITKGKVKKEGVMDNFSIYAAEQDDHFAFEYTGWIKVPKTEVYRFYTKSDDGSVLYIDDRLVVDNDGGHSKRIRSGSIGLEEGFHKIRLLYFEDYMGEILEVGLSSISVRKGLIPDQMLFRD